MFLATNQQQRAAIKGTGGINFNATSERQEFVIYKPGLFKLASNNAAPRTIHTNTIIFSSVDFARRDYVSRVMQNNGRIKILHTERERGARLLQSEKRHQVFFLCARGYKCR